MARARWRHFKGKLSDLTERFERAKPGSDEPLAAALALARATHPLSTIPTPLRWGVRGGMIGARLGGSGPGIVRQRD